MQKSVTENFVQSCITSLRPELQQELESTRRAFLGFSKILMLGIPLVFGITLVFTKASQYDEVIYLLLAYTFIVGIRTHTSPDKVSLTALILNVPLGLLLILISQFLLFEKYLPYTNFMVPLIFLVCFYFHRMVYSALMMITAFGLFALLYYIRDIEDGMQLWLLNLGSTLITGLVVYEITSRVELMAQVDALTGLYNRGYTESQLLTQINFAVRYQTPLSLLYIDADKFKAINDEFGHTRGDEILCEIAEAMLLASRNTDISSRWGGDEFIMILPMTKAEEAQKVVQRINDNLRNIEVSCGIVQLLAEEQASQFIARADQAMYQVKELRRAVATTSQQKA